MDESINQSVDNGPREAFGCSWRSMQIPEVHSSCSSPNPLRPDKFPWFYRRPRRWYTGTLHPRRRGWLKFGRLPLMIFAEELQRTEKSEKIPTPRKSDAKSNKNHSTKFSLNYCPQWNSCWRRSTYQDNVRHDGPIQAHCNFREKYKSL